MDYTPSFMKIVDEFKNKKLPLDVELSKKMGSFEILKEDVRQQEEQTATQDYENRVRGLYNQSMDQVESLRATITDKIKRIFVQTIPSDVVSTLENLEQSNPTYTEITAFLEAYKEYPMAVRRISEVCKKRFGEESWENLSTQLDTKDVDMETYIEKMDKVIHSAIEALNFYRSTDLQLVKPDGEYSNLEETSASIEANGFYKFLEREATELDTMLSNY